MYLNGIVSRDIQPQNEAGIVPRTNAINLYPALRQLIAKRFRHLQHAAFRSRVSRDVVHADEGSHRSDVDDLARFLQRQEAFCHFLGGDVAALEIDGEDLSGCEQI
jgi:hypothetical protein